MAHVTIYDVAKAAGVSPATVSRALSGQNLVSEAVARRVRATAAQLGYTPNRVARSLRRSNSSLLALIISDIENPFFTSLVRGVNDLAKTAGLSVVLFNTDEDLEQERHHLAVAAAERMAGIVFAPISERESNVATLLEHGQPVVAFDRRLRSSTVDSVTVANVLGAEQATAHLLSEGFRRIACVIGPVYTSTFRDRLRGYRVALRRFHLPEDRSLVVEGRLDEEGGYEAARRLFGLAERPEAIFSTNSLLAAGVLAYLRDVGLQLGPDLGLVTFDDTKWATIVSPRITVMRQPTYQIGAEAVRLLTQRLETPARKIETVVLETTLVIRESSLRRSAN